MRIQCVSLLFAGSVFFTLSVAAQPVELQTAARTTRVLDARSVALGGSASVSSAISYRDPAAASSFDRPQLSLTLAATENDYRSLEGFGNFYVDRERTASSNDLASLAVVIPVGATRVFAFYEAPPQLRSRQKFSSAGSGAAEPGCTPFDCMAAISYDAAAFERSEQTVGAGLAWRNDRLAVGASARRVSLTQRTELPRIYSFGFEPSFSGQDLLGQEIDSDAFAWDASARLRVSDGVVLSLAHSSGAHFDVETERCSTSAYGQPCASAWEPDQSGRGGLPAQTSVGVTWTPQQQVLFVAELVNVAYGDSEDERPSGFGRFASATLRDVRQPHVGVQYTTSGPMPVALRVGWWRNPSRYTPRSYAAVLPADGQHITAGLGVRLGNTMVDVGYDEADTLRSAVVSLGQRF